MVYTSQIVFFFHFLLKYYLQMTPFLLKKTPFCRIPEPVGPISNMMLPEFWCSIGYYELDTQELNNNNEYIIQESKGIRQ